MTEMNGHPFIYGRIHPAIVTGIKVLTDETGKDTEFFSGFVSVRLLSTNDRFEWVKWCNPFVGKNYGVITTPIPNEDVVMVQFDLRNTPYIVGMLNYNQVRRTILDTSAYEGDVDDPRLKVKGGELLLRGNNKSSLHFRNDGSTIFKLDDTKEETDADNVIILVDAQKNVTVKNAKTITAECEDAVLNCSKDATVTVQQTAKVTANKVRIDSGDVELGNGVIKAPVIRDIDKVLTVDTFGVPLLSQQYITHSGNVKAS